MHKAIHGRWRYFVNGRREGPHNAKRDRWDGLHCACAALLVRRVGSRKLDQGSDNIRYFLNGNYFIESERRCTWSQGCRKHSTNKERIE